MPLDESDTLSNASNASNSSHLSDLPDLSDFSDSINFSNSSNSSAVSDYSVASVTEQLQQLDQELNIVQAMREQIKTKLEVLALLQKNILIETQALHALEQVIQPLEEQLTDAPPNMSHTYSGPRKQDSSLR